MDVNTKKTSVKQTPDEIKAALITDMCEYQRSQEALQRVLYPEHQTTVIKLDK